MRKIKQILKNKLFKKLENQQGKQKRSTFCEERNLSSKSVSWQMQQRFFRRRKWRIFISLLYISSFLIYLLWRTTIINPNSLTLSLLYYFAELISFIIGLTLVFSLRNYNHRKPIPPKSNLKVDVFVPAYKEPLHIIRRTVIAAKNIDYNHKTFLLDDSKREDLQKLAQELDVIYLRRDNNFGAKAGNINNGLKHSDAEFIMVLDADHIAMPEALDIMLGFFADENVAMVQTPQDYYNTDSFQYVNSKKTGGLFHDQSSFYSLTQPCADSCNAASCVGTGVIYRRKALDTIGGIPCETVTEDIHTSIKLHKLGYKTVFLNESIAYGVAAADIVEYYKTRHRWGHGNLHVLSLENILFCKGLSLKQRLHYLCLGLIYLEAWQQLILLSIPSLTLIFGLQPFTITIFNILIVLFFPIISYLLLQELSCGFARYWANEIFSMARWPVYLKSFAGLWGKKIKFISSSKNIKSDIDFKLIFPQILVIFLNLFALIFGIVKIYSKEFTSGPLTTYTKNIFIENTTEVISLHTNMAEGYTIELVIIAGFWALYNIIRGSIFIYKVFYNNKNNHEFYRFKIPFPVLINNKYWGYTTSISEHSSNILLYENTSNLNVNDVVSIELFAPSGKINLTIDIYETSSKNNLTQISGKFLWENSIDMRDVLANNLYSVDWHREFLHRNAYFSTPSDLILKLFGVSLPKESKKREYKAVLIEHNNKEEYGVIVSYKDKNDSKFLITFKQMNIDKTYNICLFKEKSSQKASLYIMGTESLTSLINKGLNKAVTYKYKVKIS